MTNKIIGSYDKIFIDKGAVVEHVHLNTNQGPIYIGKNAEVMEGTMIRGPVAIGETSVIKMGTRIYGKTSFGPGCKIGGEIKNSVILGYTNKGHEGFLGNSVVGEWCNLGADTTCSNMKNTYGFAKLWSYRTNQFRQSNSQFIGAIIGDHCKTGIKTMFNTATSVGVHCNIFGHGYHEKMIPSFSWGGSEKLVVRHKLNKAIETATTMMQRRGKKMHKLDIEIMNYIFNSTARYRS